MWQVFFIFYVFTILWVSVVIWLRCWWFLLAKKIHKYKSAFTLCWTDKERSFSSPKVLPILMKTGKIAVLIITIVPWMSRMSAWPGNVPICINALDNEVIAFQHSILNYALLFHSSSPLFFHCFSFFFPFDCLHPLCLFPHFSLIIFGQI